MLNREPIFDGIRALLRGRRVSDRFTRAEVRRLDRAIDAALGLAAPVAPVPQRPQSPPPTRTSAAGVALMHRFEGCARLRADGRYAAYPDPGTGGEPWTIGWGATREGLHGRVRPGLIWTRQQCDERFADDLARVYEPAVRRAIGDAPTTQEQFDALVSFHYNTGAIARATLTRLHVAGEYEAAAREFRRWNKVKGRELAGLTRRRAAEEALYRKGIR